jgi:hypothetical protein
MPVSIVAAPLGFMDASGSGVVQKFNYTNATHSGITHIFSKEIDLTDDLWKAFTYADVNTEGSDGVDGGFAAVDVSFNPTLFEAAMVSLMATASGGYVGNSEVTTSRTAAHSDYAIESYKSLTIASSTVTATVQKEILKEVEDELDRNSILEFFEGDSLSGFTLTVDYSGGAADMAGKLALQPNLRNLFFQFPGDRTSGGVDLTTPTGTRLPVVAGDTVSFVFKLNSKIDITEEPKNPEDTAGAGVNYAAGNNTSYTASNLNLSVAGSYTTAVPSENNMIRTEFQASTDGSVEYLSGNRKVAFICKVVSATPAPAV